MDEKILIVEDEPNIVVPLQFIMKDNGYDVTVAFSGEEAVDAITESKPDLILLDIMLPGMDGYELCQMIRQNPDWKGIKIIFLTALGREADMAKGMALDADAYITKPFSNKEVVEKVRNLLQKEAALCFRYSLGAFAKANIEFDKSVFSQHHRK